VSPDAPDPLDVFNARRGMVCATGAGGKKSVLYWLASLHPGRVAVTATTFTTCFPEALAATVVVAPAAAIVAAVQAACRAGHLTAYALPGTKPGRYDGVPAECIAQLHAACQFDLTLVKADGARMRWIKAPDTGEPAIPAGATTVIPVISARALGQPLGERIAHRPERVAAACGAVPGERLSPEHIARLLAHPEGALRRAGDAMVVPCINMADDDATRALARDAAGRALAYTERFDRVAITSLRPSHAPRLEVVTRD